jgi:hypothetical protein
MTEFEKNIQQIFTDVSTGKEPSRAVKEHIFQQISSDKQPRFVALRLPVAIAVLISIMSVHLVAS